MSDSLPEGTGHPISSGKDESVTLPAGDGAGLEPKSETDLWTGRTHIMHYGFRIIFWVVAMIGVTIGLYYTSSRWEGLTGWTAFLIWCVTTMLTGLVILTKAALVILGRRYRLTTQRLFIERGIISQTIDQTELIRVDDVRVHKTIVDRLFGLGSVEVMGTDATDQHLMIEGVVSPEQVAESIRSHMRIMRRKSLFVENL